MTEDHAGTPSRPATGVNGLGLAGFIVSLVGLATGGCLSPVGFVLSLIAVFREPRGFAIAGLVIGALGLVGVGLALLLVGVMGIAAVMALLALGGAAGGFSTLQDARAIWPQIAETIRQDAELPASLEAMGSLPTETLTDHWGTPYVYERQDPKAASFTSAGADKALGTGDDLVVLLELQPDGSLLVRTPDDAVSFSVTP